MGRLNRYTQKLFGSSAAAGEVGVFGSLAAGAPAATTNPETIQSLAQYLGGWFDAIVGNKNFAIEDRNALDFLFAYQLGYLMQSGIPEYDAETDYHIGQVCNVAGVLYVSVADNNLNQAVSDATKWQLLIGRRAVKRLTVADSPYTILNSDQALEFDCTGGAIVANLPARAASVGRLFAIDKVDDSANALTINRSGADTLEGGDTSLVVENPYESIDIFAGTTFWKIRG